MKVEYKKFGEATLGHWEWWCECCDKTGKAGGAVTSEEAALAVLAEHVLWQCDKARQYVEGRLEVPDVQRKAKCLHCEMHVVLVWNINDCRLTDRRIASVYEHSIGGPVVTCIDHRPTQGPLSKEQIKQAVIDDAEEEEKVRKFLPMLATWSKARAEGKMVRAVRHGGGLIVE